jgi:hypothetical protein
MSHAYSMIFMKGTCKKMIGSHHNPISGINTGSYIGIIMDSVIVNEKGNSTRGTFKNQHHLFYQLIPIVYGASVA